MLIAVDAVVVGVVVAVVVVGGGGCITTHVFLGLFLICQ